MPFANAKQGPRGILRVPAKVVDAWDDGIVIQLDITPQLMGELWAGNIDRIEVAAVGAVAHRDRQRLKAL